MNNTKALLKVFHKHISYTAINIFGLSVGLAFFMVIVILLRFDLNYDKYWGDADQIFRIDSKFIQENSADQLALPSKLLPERLHELLPEVIGFARFSRPRKSLVKIGNKLFNEAILLKHSATIDPSNSPSIEPNFIKPLLAIDYTRSSFYQSPFQ